MCRTARKCTATPLALPATTNDSHGYGTRLPAVTEIRLTGHKSATLTTDPWLLLFTLLKKNKNTSILDYDD